MSPNTRPHHARRSYAGGIGHLELTVDEYEAFIHSPFSEDALAGDGSVTTLLVTGGHTDISSPGSLPVVVCWIGSEFGGAGPEHADVVLAEHDVADLIRQVDAAPLAATSLAVLLRAIAGCDVEHGLALESATYSVLQAGPEFASWRARTHPTPSSAASEVVRIDRDGAALAITLDRPHRHNAISTQLRDELDQALALAEGDPSISRVVLRGNGPSFCSGGDLTEFGGRPDVATAHVTRLVRSPARRMHRLRDRTTAQIHGATLGGGIELAAFAGRVTAHPDTLIGLPEIHLGLIPGAGGTVSLPRRIGRQRTAALALTARRIDAGTALAWGLVDELSEPDA